MGVTQAKTVLVEYRQATRIMKKSCRNDGFFVRLFENDGFKIKGRI